LTLVGEVRHSQSVHVGIKVAKPGIHENVCRFDAGVFDRAEYCKLRTDLMYKLAKGLQESQTVSATAGPQMPHKGIKVPSYPEQTAPG